MYLVRHKKMQTIQNCTKSEPATYLSFSLYTCMHTGGRGINLRNTYIPLTRFDPPPEKCVGMYVWLHSNHYLHSIFSTFLLEKGKYRGEVFCTSIEVLGFFLCRTRSSFAKSCSRTRYSFAIAVGLGTVLPNFAVGLDQVPRFGLGQCFCVGLGMVSRYSISIYFFRRKSNCTVPCSH